MYKKILVPLDQSQESESILPMAQELLAPGGMGILAHVIYPSWTNLSYEYVFLTSQLEDEERTRALAYLNRIAIQIGGGSRRWTCKVAVSGSVADGIATLAAQEQVDLIAMYTHDRTGLAKLIKGSVTEKVQKLATTEVQVLRPLELVAS